MALHSELPIYKTAYDLLQLVMKLVKNMSRDFKQSLGSELRDECVKVTVLILRANRAEDKSPHLLEILERHQVIELLIRLARDMKLISTGQYADAIQLTDSIGKQANGWRNQQRNTQSRPTHGGQGHHDSTLF